MNPKPPYYRIYLLTVWQEQNRGPPEQITWRFRLEDPRTGRRRAFAAVTTFLDAVLTVSVLSEEREKEDEG